MTDQLLKMIRREEKAKLIKEGYIHKSECPKMQQEKRNRELKKANNSLQRKVSELTLQIESYKMMR